MTRIIYGKQGKRKLYTLRPNFFAVMARKYKNYCDRNSEAPTFEGFLQYLHEKNLVKDEDIVRYMAIELYPKHLYLTNGVKRQAVFSLEDEIPASERTIWGWLNNQKYYDK